MKEFPENHDLIWIFESEPALLEADLPWYYNTVTFTTIREDEEIICIFSPSYGDMQIHWKKGDRELINLSVSGIDKTQTEFCKEYEILRMHFREDTPIQNLELQMKPYIKLTWGSDTIN